MDNILDTKLLKEYRTELKLCDNLGKEIDKCIEVVNTKYLRKLPQMKNMVYPWNNYDWGYDTYVDKTYNKNKTGATPDGTFAGLFKNPMAMMEIMKGFTLDANPNSGSKAGITDRPDCGSNKNCQVIEKIKKNKQEVPYPDPFFEKSLDGKSASSYFIQTGVCRKPKMSKKQCLDKKYNWVENPLFSKTPAYLRPPNFVEGTCFKPRYGYLNNKSGFNIKLPKSDNDLAKKGINQSIGMLNDVMSKFEGILPSFINDISKLSPNNIYQISQGKSTDDFTIMDCEEEFCNYEKKLGITNEQYFFITIIVVIFCMAIIVYFTKN